MKIQIRCKYLVSEGKICNRVTNTVDVEPPSVAQMNKFIEDFNAGNIAYTDQDLCPTHTDQKLVAVPCGQLR